MQKNSQFVRTETRELLPAAPPATPASDAKKSARQVSARNANKSSLPTPNTNSGKTPNLSKPGITTQDEINSQKGSPKVCPLNYMLVS